MSSRLGEQQKIYGHKNFPCFMKRLLSEKLDYNTDDCVLCGVFKSQNVNSIHAQLTFNVTNQFFPRNWSLFSLISGNILSSLAVRGVEEPWQRSLIGA